MVGPKTPPTCLRQTALLNDDANTSGAPSPSKSPAPTKEAAIAPAGQNAGPATVKTPEPLFFRNSHPGVEPELEAPTRSTSPSLSKSRAAKREKTMFSPGSVTVIGMKAVPPGGGAT